MGLELYRGETVTTGSPKSGRVRSGEGDTGVCLECDDPSKGVGFSS